MQDERDVFLVWKTGTKINLLILLQAEDLANHRGKEFGVLVPICVQCYIEYDEDEGRVAQPNQVIISRLLFEKLISCAHSSAEDGPCVDALSYADSLMSSKPGSIDASTSSQAPKSGRGRRTQLRTRKHRRTPGVSCHGRGTAM